MSRYQPLRKIWKLRASKSIHGGIEDLVIHLNKIGNKLNIIMGRKSYIPESENSGLLNEVHSTPLDNAIMKKRKKYWYEMYKS